MTSPRDRQRVAIDDVIADACGASDAAQGGASQAARGRAAPALASTESCGRCGRLVICGETVTISVQEYVALRAGLQSGKRRPGSVSPIARDAELAGFIAARADAMPTTEIIAAVAATFAKTRAPSRSAIYRFVQRVREGAFSRL